MRGCIYRTKDNECDRYSEGGKFHAFCDDNCDMAVPSNADRIRSMTDEELATWLSGVTLESDKLKRIRRWSWLDWLRQEGEE